MTGKTGQTHRSTPPHAGRALRIRAAVALGVICVAFLLLIGRLARLQVVDAAHYRELALQQQVVNRKLAARRGDIYDRNGRRLVSSLRVASVFADPQAVKDVDLTAAALADVLGLEPATVARKLRRPGRFAWIKRLVSRTEAADARKLARKLPGLHLRDEYKRFPCQGSYAAHVTGFTDVDGRGLAGIEKQLDPLLRGRPGMETVRCDGGRRIIWPGGQAPRREPFDGYNVYLTLDLCVQIIAEQELDAVMERHEPEAALALVMDARDGSLLAMASRPAFDPARPAATPVANRRNMTICDAYEFGSVFKPITIALALDAGVVSPETRFDCHNGQWRVGGRVVHDAHPYDMLTVHDILVHSSNIGAAQVCLELGVDDLYAGMARFGFGERTGVALPGEIGGIVRPRRLWNKNSAISVAFGQEIAVTPIAVVRAFATLANGGRLIQPRIIQRIEHAETGRIIYNAGEPAFSGRAVSSGTAEQIMDMLRAVVESGTGRRARIDGYAVAGKTGTAQLLRRDGRGYRDDAYLSSFVGIAPVPDSRVVVMVAVKAPSRNGYYGGVVAAPAVSNIIERTLRRLRVPRTESNRAAEGALL